MNNTQYNVYFDICALILDAFILFFYQRKQYKTQDRNRAFYTLNILLLSSCAFEIISLSMRGNPDNFIYPAAIFSTHAAHLLHIYACLAILIYIIDILRLQYIINKTGRCLIFLPAIILTFITLHPKTSSKIFFFTSDFMYHNGNWHYLIELIPMLYLFSALFILVLFNKVLGKKMYSLLFFFFTSSVITIFISVANLHLKITHFLQSLLLFTALMTIENTELRSNSTTDLFSRSTFLEDIRVLLHTPYKSSFVVIKIKSFQYYNVTFGTENFTKVINSIANWLQQRDCSGHTSYYFGNGVFAVLLVSTDENNAYSEAEAINERFKNSWNNQGFKLRLNAQIWHASIPENAATIEQVIAVIDEPFDNSQPYGKVLTANPSDRLQRRYQVIRAITKAVNTKAFEVYYQPIISVKSKAAHSAEALLRLNDSVLGIVNPEEFIREAERSGQINEIGNFVFEEICSTLSKIDRLNIPSMRIGFNLSPLQCMDEDLPDRFKSILEKYHLTTDRFILEITETNNIENMEQMNRVFDKFKEMGFSFALDDFGTGYANYEYIIRFPFSVVKIDKSILWAADDNNENATILNHIIRFIHDLGKEILVEGVESEQQNLYLENENVHYIQGFYYSEPLPQSDFIHYIKSFNHVR